MSPLAHAKNKNPAAIVVASGAKGFSRLDSIQCHIQLPPRLQA